MPEQISLLTTILAALLTGGFLMLFIESQHISSNLAERFHYKLGTFYHSLTNYTKFISAFKSCFTFSHNESGHMRKLQTNLEKIARLGSKSIITGQDYPVTYFTAEQLQTINETINNIWYHIDNDQEGFSKISFDTHHAQLFNEYITGYLKEISPKYKDTPLTKDTIYTISGEFYTEIYQPIAHILPQYEYWQKKERRFKYLAFATLSICLLTMVSIIVACLHIPLCILSGACALCCLLLLIELYQLIRLEELAKKIIR